MFSNIMQKTKELVISGKATLYIRVIILTLILATSLTMAGPAMAFGPMPGGVGG